MNMLLAFDTVAAAVLATVCGWAVMSPRIHDGLVIKAGLILMSLGLALLSFSLADAAEVARPYIVAGSLVLVGLLVVVVGAALRVMNTPPRRRRRVTDWGDLSDTGAAR